MKHSWRERETCSECGEYNVHCTCDDVDPIDVEVATKLLRRATAHLRRHGIVDTDKGSADYLAVLILDKAIDEVSQ